MIPSHVFSPVAPRPERLHRAHLEPLRTALTDPGWTAVPFAAAALRRDGADLGRAEWTRILRGVVAPELPQWARPHIADRGSPVPFVLGAWRGVGPVHTGEAAPPGEIEVPREDGRGVCWIPEAAVESGLFLPPALLAIALLFSHGTVLTDALTVELVRRTARDADAADLLRELYHFAPEAIPHVLRDVKDVGPLANRVVRDRRTAAHARPDPWRFARAPDPPLTAPRGRARR